MNAVTKPNSPQTAPASHRRSHSRERFKKRAVAGGSSAFLLATLIVCSLLLAINVTLILAAHTWLSQYAPEFFRESKFKQGVLLIAPLLLLGFEWWVIDAIVYRLSGDARRDAGRRRHRRDR